MDATVVVAKKTYAEWQANLRTKRTRRQNRQGGGNGWLTTSKKKNVIDRDNWVCQLCGKKIDPQFIDPHPKAATVDHIVPKSQGGTHYADNLQAAHYGCNQAKQNKLQ